MERTPFLDVQPPNFFGTQMAGTAVADAVNLLKGEHIEQDTEKKEREEECKPLGSRILLSPAAGSHWPRERAKLVVSDGRGNEFVPERSVSSCLFDCVYYLLCLRGHEPGSRPFGHYVWSFASRVRAAGNDAVPGVAIDLVARVCTDAHLRAAADAIKEALRSYERAGSPSLPGASTER